jgi:apolipoprotein N-acyltransferase
VIRALSPAALRAHPAGRTALALLAGAATVSAFAPLEWALVGVAAFALLIELWVAAQSPRSAFWSGFWFGLGLFGAGVSWVYVSLHRYGEMAAPLAAIATLGFCALLALFPAAVGWLQARWRISPAARACLVIPALWAFAEWLRGWLFTGFPWLSAGYAAIDTPLAGWAPLGGVYALSLGALACAGFLWCVVRNRARWIALGLLAVLLGAGALLRTHAWSIPEGALRVSLLQGDIPQQLKFDPALYARTLATYAYLAEGSRGKLIVLPETAVPRFLDSIDPAYLDRLESVAKRHGGDLLLGVPYQPAPGVYYNSVVSLGVSPPQIYNKVHLVPFGEFIPPGFGWIVHALSIPLSDFSSGSPEQRPLRVAGTRVAVDICYEDAFGEEIARELPEAALLVNVSNDAWFGDSLAPAQHLQMGRMRALETGRMMLTATNTGITAAVARDGRVLGRLPQFALGRLEISALLYRGATPYVRIGDLGVLAAIALLLAAALVLARRARSG